MSERLIDYLATQFPGQPIRAVGLTHFHDDHAGGARAFAAAGATIYAPGQSTSFLNKALNRLSMPDDRFDQRGGRITVSPVTDSVVIGSAPNRVKLVSMGHSPHVDAQLGVWALDKDYFFVSDVHVPRSDASSPRTHRAATECWFAAWAASNLPNDVRVVNSHSEVSTPVARLAEYLESDPCRK
ncbi:MAG: MBL fold metallo-hydrolase [Gammaproteobacteria bacterium]|nr:MBL fold metallo-hydrolase [Gammaproteobacteria bacterium]